MKLSKIASLLNPINLMQKINDLIDVARSPLKRSTAYVVGDIVHVYALPSNLYLECVEAGTTSFYALSLSETPNTELTDGTVKWMVRDKNDIVRKSGVASVGSTTVPVYFDANGNAQEIAYSIEKSVPANAEFTDTIVDISGKANIASPTFTGTPAAPTAAKATNTTQIATTAYVKNNLNDYLPLSGGTLSGGITFSANRTIKNNTNTYHLLLCGGVDAQVGSGAKAYFYGGEHTSNAGEFLIQAGYANAYKQLIGKPDGTFTWGGENIVVVKAEVKNATGYVKFSNGLIAQWGVTPASTSAGLQTVTLPTPFNSTTYRVIVTDTISSASGQSSCYSYATITYSKSQFRMICENSSNHAANFIAIGY